MKFKKSLLALLIASVCFTAQAANEILVNEYIKVGVNETTGTLGSGGNTSPGIQYDNTGTGTFNPSYDYLTPGSPYEGWAVRIDNATGTRLQLYGNNNAGFQMDGNTAVSGAWVGTTTAASAVWAGSATEFNIRHTYSLPAAQRYLDITTRIDATAAMPALYFGRYIDPDAVAAPGDSSATDNVRGYGIIPKTNVVFSEATVSRYALGLYSAQVGTVNTSIQGWTSDPKNYYLNTGGRADVSTGDDTIGIAFYAANVAVGDILTYNYAYIFGPSAFTAANYAITGGAGGGTAGTSSFGTLVDVGSATDAGSGTTTPTVTSTTTATIVVSDTTVVSVSLPVITASLAHHEASEGGGKQTVARETTTNVTTPMERNLTTLVRTTTNYSDGTSTVSDSASTTATTISNSVATSVLNESFSGRIDQHDQLSNLNLGINQSLNMNPFRMDVYKTEEGNFFLRGGGLQTAMGDGYSAKSDLVNIGGDKQINSNWRLGAQYSRVNTKMPGSDSYTSQNKNAVGLYSIYTTDDDAIITTNVGYAKNDIGSNRNVENVFSNSHNTKGTDAWISNRVYAPELPETAVSIRPFLGYTFGSSKRDGYTESGDIQSARTVAGVNQSVSYGEIGARLSKKIDNVNISGELSGTSNGFSNTEVGVAYSPEKNQSVGVYANRQSKDNQTTNSWFIRGIMRF